MSDEVAGILIRIGPWNEASGAYPVEAELDDGSRFLGGELRLERSRLLAGESDAQGYGLELFHALLAGPIGRAYERATGRAEAEMGGRLRVQLWIDEDAAELHALAWERLYHLHRGQPVPVATSTLTPFSRYTGLELAEAEPVTGRPIRLLFAIANPEDLPPGFSPVPVEEEVEALAAALGDVGPGLFQVTLLPGRTGISDELRGRLETQGYNVREGVTGLDNILRHLPGHHVFHFLGHGVFRREVERGAGTAALYLEAEQGTLDIAQDGVLVPRLAALDPLPHLVFLAACESAKRPMDSEHPYVGLAPRLVGAGVPAVVAMQDRVPMGLARQLTADFYRRLLEHGCVDVALNESRQLLFRQEGADWAIPVLFMRLKTGQLFAAEPAEGTTVPAAAPFTVPFPRNKWFVGREAELAWLHRHLQAEQKAVGITPAGISGMGGIGKTQLAVEYAYRYRQAYPDGVLWVNAARVEEWARELVGLADRIGLAPADASSPDRTGQMVAALARHLADHPRTLVVFDNVAEPRHLQTVWLGPGLTPAELGGALLFTTRRREMPPGVAGLDVHVLPRESSRQMILAARPEAAGDPALKRLCAALGDLPLALELAAAALRHRPRLSLADYLAKLGELGADVVHVKARVEPADLASYYAASLTPALQAQWDALADAGPAGRDARLLLRAAAQLGEAEWIPVARLGLLTGLRDDPAGLEEPLADAVRELVANCLVEPMAAGDTGPDPQVRLHPLVRDFAARQTPETETAAYRSSLAANLAAAYSDIAVLEDHCARRGIDALQGDLLAALRLLPQTSQTSELSENLRGLETRLRSLLRMSQREAHHLRGWDAARRPAFFAQQVARWAAIFGLPELATGAEAHLTRGRAPYLWQCWRASVESAALERILKGHDGLVNTVAVTADGQRAISGSSDGTLRVWDLESGQGVAVFRGHEGEVNAVAVTADGQRAVSGADDGVVRLWDLAAGQEVAALHGHEKEVRAVAADGRRAVSGGSDETVRVWDLELEQEVARLRGHEGGVNAVALTADGRRVVSGSDDQTLRVWDAVAGQEVATLRGHEGGVDAVAVTADGRRAVSGSGDRTVRVWDLEFRQEVATLRGHQGGVITVAVTADGQRAISGSYDGTLRVWDLSSLSDAGLETGREVATLRGHQGGVNAVAVTADGRRAVSGADDGTVRVWDLSAGQEVIAQHGHRDVVTAVVATADGRRAVSGSGDRTLRVWDLESGQEVATLRGHEGGVNAVAVTADGQRAVSSSGDETLRVWDLESGQEVETLRRHASWVRAVALMADEWRAVSGSDDGTVRLWDLEAGQEVATLHGHTDWVWAVALTANGRRALSGSADGTVRLWDLATAREVATLRGHEGSVHALAVTVDGRRVMSSSSDGTVRVWDLDSGQEKAMAALEGSLQCLALAADGSTLLAGDDAGNVYCFRYVDPAAER